MSASHQGSLLEHPHPNYLYLELLWNMVSKTGHASALALLLALGCLFSPANAQGCSGLAPGTLLSIPAESGCPASGVVCLASGINATFSCPLGTVFPDSVKECTSPVALPADSKCAVKLKLPFNPKPYKATYQLRSFTCTNSSAGLFSLKTSNLAYAAESTLAAVPGSGSFCVAHDSTGPAVLSFSSFGGNTSDSTGRPVAVKVAGYIHGCITSYNITVVTYSSEGKVLEKRTTMPKWDSMKPTDMFTW